ncbi:hypothetical protein [Nostoc sp. FACHB-133]|nr:hypothetical protein [Nostoc sp. FACHB-133]MBD2527970.1 hypothetical protein [Nostoc sp. FACHB-133]
MAVTCYHSLNKIDAVCHRKANSFAPAACIKSGGKQKKGAVLALCSAL